MKRLGMYYATACYRDEQGRYFTSGGLGRYLQVLNARYSFEVVLAAPVTTQPLDHLCFPLPVARVRVYELPYFETFLGAMKVRHWLLQRLRGFVHHESVHVLWLRYPGAYGTALWREAKRMGVPVFYELVGDPVGLLSASGQLSGWKRLIAVAVARWHEYILKQQLRQTPAFAISTALAEHYAVPNAGLPVIAVSTLLQADFFQREDTCQATPVNVLFVGVLRHEKSVDTLIQAVGLLQQRNQPVHLHVVGDGPERANLEREALRCLQPNTVHFHGFQTDPAMLHRFYVNADLFVLCSVSEGLGRVVLEAMARGVPVVATRVGGIPDLVRDGETGLLVPPRDPEALAHAMDRIIHDEGLRRRLIASGYCVAERHTAERFLDDVMQFIATHTGIDLVTQKVQS